MLGTAASIALGGEEGFFLLLMGLSFLGSDESPQDPLMLPLLKNPDPQKELLCAFPFDFLKTWSQPSWEDVPGNPFPTGRLSPVLASHLGRTSLLSPTCPPLGSAPLLMGSLIHKAHRKSHARHVEALLLISETPPPMLSGPCCPNCTA